MVTLAQPGPIATRLVKELRKVKSGRVVDLGAFREGTKNAAELQKSVATRDDLSDFHPAHALYVYVQNQVSVLAEQLTALPATAKLADVIEAAQDEYMPGGPPMSPLTTSYFTCWAFFDASAGPLHETLGTCVMAVGEALGMSLDFLRMVQAMQSSAMSVFQHEGFEADGTTQLRDLVSGAQASCIVPSGWRGSRGDLLLGRVLPPPTSAASPSVLFTTPYVRRGATAQDWLAYFERTLGPSRGDRDKRTSALKFSVDWSEFIFAGYAGHVHEAIFLEGLPDVPRMLPHGRQR
jgi:hypothetical protein